MALKDRILEYLNQFGPTSDKKLSGALDTSNQHVNQTVRRLETQGIIRRVQDGTGSIQNHLMAKGKSIGARTSAPSTRRDDAETVESSHAARLVLEQLGFLLVGTWAIAGDGIRCNLERHSSARNVLYAFLKGDFLLYLGKTTQPLQRRMYGYQNPGPSQRTNYRCNELLGSVLGDGSCVEIHVLIDNGLIEYRGYKVNLAAGLEDTLIAELTPPWNKQGV